MTTVRFAFSSDSRVFSAAVLLVGKTHTQQQQSHCECNKRPVLARGTTDEHVTIVVGSERVECSRLAGELGWLTELPLHHVQRLQRSRCCLRQRVSSGRLGMFLGKFGESLFFTRCTEKSPPLWGRDNEGGKASDWSRIQNPAF